MSAVLKRPPLYRRPEIGRRVVGALFEIGLKAYGAAAAVSVALSDAETVGGKGHDALAAVPNLMERYRDAKYVVDHGEEIQTALDYVNQHAPDPQQIETAAQTSYETLHGITTVFSEVAEAKAALANLNVFESFPQAAEHLGRAWGARPDLDSIRHLAAMAEDVAPVVRQLNDLVDLRRLHEGLLAVVDNFASDEIAATLGVMGAAFGLAFAFGMGAGFWARRGRPGFIARTLQSWGARLFRGWYVRNLEIALSRPLYAAARERIQSDILTDPTKALDPETLKELERYFERRVREKPTALSESVMAPRPSR
jgi:hypothetical protein